MNRSETLYTFAIMTLGQGIRRVAGTMSAAVVGSVLTTRMDADANGFLQAGLDALDAFDGPDQSPITVADFTAEVRRVAGSDAVSDAEALAHMEFNKANAGIGRISMGN